MAQSDGMASEIIVWNNLPHGTGTFPVHCAIVDRVWD